jgi:hypothetical protein
MSQEATTADVLAHHLTMLAAGQLDEVMLDYSDQSVLMSPDQSFHGLAEIRAFFHAAIVGSPPGMLQAITLVHQDIHDEIAYIVWKAEPFVKSGTDTFVIRAGKILAQTYLMVS